MKDKQATNRELRSSGLLLNE